MTDIKDEKITQLFDRAEIELPDEGFSAQVMLKVARHRKHVAVFWYGAWVLALLCFLSISPTVINLSLHLGNTIGPLPVLLMNSIQPFLNLTNVLLVLTPLVGYVLMKLRLLGLPRG
jgi:hypothetical protein